MHVFHNRQTIDINLTAEARVRCWVGNTRVEGLIDPTEVKTCHHPTVAALDRKLRGAIKAIEETTGAGKTEDTESRADVDDVEPDDLTLVESCLRQDAIWQDAVRQAEPRAFATIPTSDTHVMMNQLKAGRMEEGAADTAEIPASDTDVIMNQLEAGRMEKGAADAAETATKATGQGRNTSAVVLSPLLTSKSVHSQTMTDSRASDAGEQAEDCDWDLVDATEVLEL